MLHGFVSWAVTTLLYVILATSAVGAILGGTFRIVGAGMQVGAQVAGGSQNTLDQLAGMISGGGQGQVNAQSLSAVQQAIAAGDRESAINIMINEMGFSPENASQMVDRMTPLLTQSGRDVATRATDVLTATSWWLFIGLLLSLALGIAGGVAGVRATGHRLLGDHTTERHTPITNP
jgi:hypothetical protein